MKIKPRYSIVILPDNVTDSNDLMVWLLCHWKRQLDSGRVHLGLNYRTGYYRKFIPKKKP